MQGLVHAFESSDLVEMESMLFDLWDGRVEPDTSPEADDLHRVLPDVRDGGLHPEDVLDVVDRERMLRDLRDGLLEKKTAFDACNEDPLLVDSVESGVHPRESRESADLEFPLANLRDGLLEPLTPPEFFRPEDHLLCEMVPDGRLHALFYLLLTSTPPRQNPSRNFYEDGTLELVTEGSILRFTQVRSSTPPAPVDTVERPRVLLDPTKQTPLSVLQHLDPTLDHTSLIESVP